MNIKQSITLLLLMMGVSFSGLSHATVKVSGISLASSSGQSMYGKVFSSRQAALDYGAGLGCQEVPPANVYKGRIAELAYINGNELYKRMYKVAGCTGTVAASSNANLLTTPYTCPDGEKVNDDTGVCEQDISCLDLTGTNAPFPPPINPDDGKLPTATRLWCETNTMCEVAKGYYASGGNMIKFSNYTGLDCIGDSEDYSECVYYGGCEGAEPEPELPDPWDGCEKPYDELDFLCPEDTDGDGRPNLDAPTDLRAFCNYNENLEFQCTGGTYSPTEPTDPTEPTKPTDPTEPFDPSDPKNPIDVDPENPNPTDPELPVEDVTPTEPDSSDAGTIKAVRNLNTDINKALNSLNRDNNDNFNNLNNELRKLNSKSDAINDNVVSQMQQDYQIYQNTKALILAQTGDLKLAAGENLDKQIASDQLEASGIRSELKRQGDAITDAIKSIPTGGGDAKEPCDPNTDSRSCEGQSGMTKQLAYDIDAQVNEAVSAGFDTVETEMIDTVQSYIDDSQLGAMETVMNDAVSLALQAMPDIKDCTSFSIPSPFGGSVDFGCEFSVKFKAVASFLLYVYTLWTLIDILLGGVTPVAGTVPYMSRRG